MRNFKKREGFTVAEMIVAMGVFSIAVTLAVGAFVQSLRTQRMVNNLMAVSSNASIVLEQMMREMRTGSNFAAIQGAGCAAAGQFDSISFTNAKNEAVTYVKENNAVSRNTKPLTASNVLASRLCFALNNPEENPRVSPWKVTLFLTIGSSDPRLSEKAINMETTVSARVLPSDIQ